MNKGWYVVHTQTGRESTVKEYLENRIKLEKKEEVISDILVPTENVSEVKEGKRRITKRKFFPGYVLIEMEMNDENWSMVRHAPGVTGFVGAALRPTPLDPKEVETIVRQTEEKQSKLRPKVEYEKGESVKITEGPFMSFSGLIEEVFPDKGKLKVMVSIFGRSTPVELEYWQVEKI